MWVKVSGEAVKGSSACLKAIEVDALGFRAGRARAALRFKRAAGRAGPELLHFYEAYRTSALEAPRAATPLCRLARRPDTLRRAARGRRRCRPSFRQQPTTGRESSDTNALQAAPAPGKGRRGSFSPAVVPASPPDRGSVYLATIAGSAKWRPTVAVLACPLRRDAVIGARAAIASRAPRYRAAAPGGRSSRAIASRAPGTRRR